VPETPTVEFISSYLQKYGILCFLPEDRLQLRVYFFSRGDSIEAFIVGDKILHGFSSIIQKNNEKINKKKLVFSTESKKQH